MFSSTGLWPPVPLSLSPGRYQQQLRREAGSRIQVSDCQSRVLPSPNLLSTQQGKCRLEVQQAHPASGTSSLSTCDSNKGKKQSVSTVWHSLALLPCCCVEHLLTNSGARAEPNHISTLLQHLSPLAHQSQLRASPAHSCSSQG